jgi:hypothetical protein
MARKQSLESCLAEYTSVELINFHANLNALFMCCNEDFHLLPLLMRVHFAIAQRKDTLSTKYLAGVDAVLQVPDEYKYKKI